MELIVRFDYGWRIPWVRRLGQTLRLVAGPDALRLDFPVEIEPRGFTHVGEFVVSAGEKVPFVFSWHPSSSECRGRSTPLRR